MPVWLGTEVTHDDRYSGGRLARATPDEVRALLARE
jgi:CYTH domain-containing protein